MRPAGAVGTAAHWTVTQATRALLHRYGDIDYVVLYCHESVP